MAVAEKQECSTDQAVLLELVWAGEGRSAGVDRIHARPIVGYPPGAWSKGEYESLLRQVAGVHGCMVQDIACCRFWNGSMFDWIWDDASLRAALRLARDRGQARLRLFLVSKSALCDATPPTLPSVLPTCDDSFFACPLF